MERLYYNCDDPVAILRSGHIRLSKIFTGVSLSEWSELGSHGPFKITFNRSDSFRSCIRVQYWTVGDTRLRWNGSPILVRRGYYASNQDGEQVSETEYYTRLAATERTYPDYTHRVWKTSDLFCDEHEWYSSTPIVFDETDVLGVTFMLNAPCLIGPRKLPIMKARLADMLGERYTERAVADHRLRK